MFKAECKTFRHQLGAAAVEFAIVAMLLLTLLFSIIEFGRMFYVFNTVQEVTRRAAREAVVNLTANMADIQRRAILKPASTDTEVGLVGASEVTNIKVSIKYLHGVWNSNLGAWEFTEVISGGGAENIGECLNNTDNCINFVEAKVCERKGSNCNPVLYEPMVGLFKSVFIDLSLPIPVSTVIMPAESMGYLR